MNNNTTGEYAYSLLRKSLVDSGRNYDMQAVDKAYELAETAHAGQMRRSGDPYVTHPIAVADILLELGMDTDSIVAALLHDVVEDTKVEIDEVEELFGADVAQLVGGVTKLGRISFSSMEEQQSENLRKMLLAMSYDVRVMIIKLCDRLHNMRTADAWEPQKRRDKARETMEVFAPIAHRLGMSGIKQELEDRSLYYLDPIGYGEIIELIGRKNEAISFVEDIAERIRERLTASGIKDVAILSRVKGIYSIYRKMFVQNRNFEEIYDIYAVRIITKAISECYGVLGVIHDMYHPLPHRFKDYISTPKTNMYQSIHTTVIDHKGIAFEVQIRTDGMNQLAEYGVAAHWKYKEGVQGRDKLEERLAWVRHLLESQRDSADGGELLRDIKSELVPESVFAFTPKGDVIDLPAGATVIDFAYAIHSAVGNRMVGAKVNGRIVPIEHKVQTGEVIEILPGSRDKGPSRDWMKVVATSEAKSKIRNWFKKEQREENIVEGKNALDRELRRNMISVPSEDYDEFMENIAKRQRMNTAEEMYAAIGYGGLQVARLMNKVKEEYTKLVKEKSPEKTFDITDLPPTSKASEGVVVDGFDNPPIKFARCCNPLPGDEIAGFITRGYGISIHKKSCVNVEAVGESPRWVHAEWEDSVKDNSFRSTLDVTGMDRDGFFMDISGVLLDMRVPLYSVNARIMPDGRARVSVLVGVQNTVHLNNIIQKLKKVKGVLDITRS